MKGVLLKRSGDGDKKRLSLIDGWLERFFELKEGQLQYWRSEPDYTMGARGRLETGLQLKDYEILVDTSDPHWGFALQPKSASGVRGWHLRARSESDRLEWTQKLLLASMLPDS
ncbi:hypothetical protein AB1Y20_021461 [Prymnesium parvum]|uniref:PH domain-containing protein n=1 Tax=Prymnesium parvum TaxID=97485 RepID=A0AB34JJM1_PRYPA